MIQTLTSILLEMNRNLDDGKDVLEVLQAFAGHLASAFSARATMLFQIGMTPFTVKPLQTVGLKPEESDALAQILNARILDCLREEPGSFSLPDAAGSPVPCLIVPLVQHVGQWVMLLLLNVSSSIDCDNCCKTLQSVLDTHGAAIRVAWRYSRYFDVFRNVSAAIHSGEDIQSILQTIVQQAAEAMAAKGCIFWIVNEEHRRIENSAMHGFSYASLASVDYPTLCNLFGQCGTAPVLIEDARYESRIPDLERLGKKRVRSIVGVPVSIVDEYRGILAVYFGQIKRPSKREIDFLKALAEQGALALQRAMRYDRNMIDAFRQTIEGLALAIEAKDATTHGHSLKVATYCRMTALEFGLSDKEAELLYRAGLLHDIGKIGIRDQHLNKLGNLNAKEYAAIRKHPQIGAAILQPLTFLKDIVALVNYHHERYDGSGYPEGLRGEAIPLGARILAACDCFETMISGRAYIQAISLPEAMTKLRQMAGKTLDPQVVDALIRAIEHHPEDMNLSATIPLPAEPELIDWMKRFQPIF